MKVSFVKPGVVLSPYIERFWSWENETDDLGYLPHLPPGVGVELYFHYKKPFELTGQGALHSSHLIFSEDKSYPILPAAQFGFIVVRFRCGMFGNFSSIPVHELTNTFVDAGTIWKTEGKELEDQMSAANNMEERVQLLEMFLCKQLGRYNKSADNVNAIINTLYYHHDEARLDTLAGQLNITPRHFRRVFYEVSGMTPKHFQQLSRFHAVVKELLMSRNTDYLPVALAHGYFDQMHFIKEFKRFMGITPSAFLNANNFQSHFYYKSLK